MENQPLISILMPAYNCEKYIEEAIVSVINQDYKNWELVICDDCSTDNTFEIVEKYSTLDKRIKIIRNKKNMRQAFSRNQAFEKSKGEFIAILDSDDRIKSNRLSKQLDFLLQNPEYSFVCSNATMFENNKTIGYINKKMYPTALDIIRNKGFVYGTMMIRREVFGKVEGYTVSDITITGEDYDLICKIYKDKGIGANIAEYLYEYRIVDNYKRRPYKAYLDEYKVAMKHIKNGWLKSNNLSNKTMLYAYIPLIKGIIPQSLIKVYHHYKFKSEVK